MIPHFIVREAVAENALQLLLRDWKIPPVVIHVVYPASPFVPAKVRAFVHLCVQEMPGRFGEIRLIHVRGIRLRERDRWDMNKGQLLRFAAPKPPFR